MYIYIKDSFYITFLVPLTKLIIIRNIRAMEMFMINEFYYIYFIFIKLMCVKLVSITVDEKRNSEMVYIAYT